MASARYTMLMLGGAKCSVARDDGKRRLCVASRSSTTQRQRSSVDAVMVPKVMRLAAPPERKGARELVPLTISVNLTPEPDGNEGIDSAEGVVCNDEPEILQ